MTPISEALKKHVENKETFFFSSPTNPMHRAGNAARREGKKKQTSLESTRKRTKQKGRVIELSSFKSSIKHWRYASTSPDTHPTEVVKIQCHKSPSSYLFALFVPVLIKVS